MFSSEKPIYIIIQVAISSGSYGKWTVVKKHLQVKSTARGGNQEAPHNRNNFPNSIMKQTLIVIINLLQTSLFLFF
ncbi:hypothetical protein Q763_12655 [Flavobacterium beibuense F44-8]|uniref:Uncharacterized protein n=1 Tax=Flavobacterium beibuense F44-8 TaxID=1406840 RepID=A0A0A2LU93_9FLAO|nr:hypothetical protein Q763_12655 [Flavobacterium beibuense F44-8]